MARVAAAAALLAVASAQEQMHLSITGKAGEMALDFVAAATATGITVKLGASAIPVDCKTATLNGYTAQFCVALFTGLTADTQYSYSVKSSAASSPVYSFTSEPSSRPPVFAVYADFGIGNDESMTALYADAKKGGFDYVIHAGDWAYDLDTKSSETGNAFMRAIEPYAATVPYMGTVGNHEAYGTQGGGAFANYAQRQRALAMYAGTNSGSNSSFWYSFDTPLIHWIAFSGESWTMSPAQLATQAAWVAEDLAAVDRSRTPWVVAFSHKSYMMDQTTWGLYDFLAEFKVDVQFSGHWHQYTRYPPIDSRGNKVTIDAASVSADKSVYTNPRFPTLIVTGAPGDVEVNPKGCSEPNNLYCSGNYGYGWAQAVNATHFHWQWNTTVPVQGSADPHFHDELWIVKTVF